MRIPFSAAAFRTFVLASAAVGVALALSMVVIALVGHDPLAALSALYEGSFGGSTQIANTVATAVPLTLVALGWILAFSTGRISIGFPGQIVMGGIAATAVGVSLGGLARGLHLPLALLAGAVAGAAWAAIAAWLWARRGVNEIISTLLLNLIALQILSWMVQGPLQEPTGSLPTSEVIPVTAQWPSLGGSASVSWDIALAVFAVVAVTLLARTTFGTQLRLTGLNATTAAYAGIKTTKVSVVALIASGALGGLAGTSLLLGGRLTSLSEGFAANYGFEGIVVALLARNNPWGSIVAALLFSAFIQGGGYMEATVGVSADVVLITQGLVVMLVTAPEFLRGRRLRAPKPPAGEAAEGSHVSEAAVEWT